MAFLTHSIDILLVLSLWLLPLSYIFLLFVKPIKVLELVLVTIGLFGSYMLLTESAFRNSPNLIFNLVVLFIYSLYLCISFYKTIGNILVPILIFNIVDVLTDVLTGFIFKHFQGRSLYFIFIASICIIMIATFMFFHPNSRYRKSIVTLVEITNELPIYIQIVGVILVLAERAGLSYLNQLSIVSSNSLELFVLLFVFICFISLILIGDYQLNIKKSKVEIQFLTEYSKRLEETTQEVSRIQHDYKNMFLMLSYYIDQSKEDELKTFYYETFLKHSRVTITQMDVLTSLENIKTDYLRGFFLVKISDAKSKNISILVECPEKILLDKVDPVDLIRVLGILLDNALEAAAETDLIVEVLLEVESDYYMITIINSFNDENLQLSTILKEGHSTKAGHLGIGLSNALRIGKEQMTTTLEIKKNIFISKIKIAK